LPAKSASGPPFGEKCWHLDEVVIFIGAQDHWLWWVADQDGFILDVLVQSPRNKRPPNG
jgi:putative transposase